MNVSPAKTRIGIATGVLAGVAGLALVTGFGPAPSLVPIASAQDGSDDPSTSTTVDDSPSTTVAPSPTTPPGAGTRVVDAAGAGTVTVASVDGSLELVSATPAAGWAVEVEQSSGREVEVDFRQGEQRVQVNLEIEDGTIRERVRIRDDALGIDVRIENGVVVRAEGLDGADDDSGSGTSGHGGSDDAPGDHNGGTGHGADDAPGDDSGSGGHGTDDGPGDDHGGSVEPGDDNGGHGNEPGDDNGGDDEPGDDDGSGGHGADD